MAITHQDGSVTHAGQVVSVENFYTPGAWSHEQGTQAVCWTGTTVEIVKLRVVSYHDDYPPTSEVRGTAEVDATPETLAAIEGFRAGEAQGIRYREILDGPHEVLRGMVVVVARGRKVARGTRGLVTWVGDGQYGRRVGIEDASGQVHWTAVSNVEILDLRTQRPGAPKPQPEAVVARVAKDQPVTVRGQVGIVFWVNGSRLGIRTSDRREAGRYVDVIWCNASEVSDQVAA